MNPIMEAANQTYPFVVNFMEMPNFAVLFVLVHMAWFAMTLVLWKLASAKRTSAFMAVFSLVYLTSPLYLLVWFVESPLILIDWESIVCTVMYTVAIAGTGYLSVVWLKRKLKEASETNPLSLTAKKGKGGATY